MFLVKILAFVRAYIPTHNAGAETTLHDILRSFVQMGWEVNVLLSKRELDGATAPYQIDGVCVTPHDPYDKTRFNRDVSQHDLIIAHLETAERAAYVCRGMRKPLIQVVHNTKWQTEGYLSEGCDLAIYNTVWVASHHESAAKEPFIRVASAGDDFRPNKIEWRARRQSQWDSVIVHPMINPDEYRAEDGDHDHITLINLFANKGPDVFYEMAARFPNYKFLAVVGGYGDQDIREAHNVEILPNTADMRPVYAKTKLLLMPSSYESFGRVAIEAAASGIPTIASPTPGLLEALGPEGTYADPTEYDEWEAQITRIMKPRAYGKAKKHALSRSDYWAEQVPIEKEQLVQKVLEIAKKKQVTFN